MSLLWSSVGFELASPGTPGVICSNLSRAPDCCRWRSTYKGLINRVVFSRASTGKIFLNGRRWPNGLKSDCWARGKWPNHERWNLSVVRYRIRCAGKNNNFVRFSVRGVRVLKGRKYTAYLLADLDCWMLERAS